MRVALTATPSVARFAPIAFRGKAVEAFALARKLGFDGVELHLRSVDDVDRTEIKRLVNETGLGVPTLGTGMAAGEDGLTLSDPDPMVRRAAVERVRGHIELAAELGSMVTIGIMSGKLGHNPDERPARRAGAIESLLEVCEVAREAGVTILLEPLNRYECDWISTLSDGIAVTNELGCPNLKLLADTFHENIEEADICKSIREAAPYLGHVHLVDTNRQAVGHGHLEVRAVLDTFKDTGYNGWYSFEVLPIPDAETALADGLMTLKSLGGLQWT